MWSGKRSKIKKYMMV